MYEGGNFLKPRNEGSRESQGFNRSSDQLEKGEIKRELNELVKSEL